MPFDYRALYILAARALYEIQGHLDAQNYHLARQAANHALQTMEDHISHIEQTHTDPLIRDTAENEWICLRALQGKSLGYDGPVPDLDDWLDDEQ
ncbi:MAG: hypothetical protein IJC44_04760 [Clostridia bacterium]|nr:hypothetical protein [Clostridia bacterium]MBQ3091819.1 hypothetical protein [Clostridia bacterium]